MRKLRWNSYKEIKKSLSAINNMILNDEITTDKARAINYNCNTILAAIKQFETEKEIEEIRSLVEEIQKEADKDEK